MQYLKKCFMEGLIQMAILLSLCGVRVDVGLEPYLPPSWQEMILGPTAALTQTQFHNLRNRLEGGHNLHPKNVDLDGFFTARRLLGWVHSLDRLQVPHAELETWLVQQEQDPLPVGFLEQTSPLVRAPARVERDLVAVESRPSLGSLQEEEEDEDKEEGTHHAPHHTGAQDEREEEEQEEDLGWMHRHYRRAEGGGRPGGSFNSREPPQNEVDQTSFSLQECLRLLEETFPFTEEQQQLHDVGHQGEDLGHQSPDGEPMLSSTVPTRNLSLDLELHWQDLWAIMAPQHNIDVDLITTGTPEGVRSETLQQNCNNPDNDLMVADQEIPLMETPLQHGLFAQSELESALLPLMPSEELDDHSSALNTMDPLNNSHVNPFHNPPDHTELLTEDQSQDFCLGLDAEDNSGLLNMNLLTQDLADTMEASPYPYPENLPSDGVNCNSSDSAPSSFSSFLEGNAVTQDLLTSPSSAFFLDEEDVEDEDDLPSPLNDLIGDAAILDEIRLLDLALEEGFSPEMAARLDEEGYLYREIAQQETGRDNGLSSSSMMATKDQRQARKYQQDGENEADSDSGLSLDFSHSQTSPCPSDSSSLSSSSSSSSCVSAEESPFSEDEDEDAVEQLDYPDLEMEVTIKQEELEEEELGAVGGRYPEDVKQPFPPNFGDDKLFNGFPWLEHIGHDHTYNQPWSSVSPPSLGKMAAKQTKSNLRYDSAKPYHHSSSRHISETKMWSRDERRARALKVPFSTELIVNLPVEEFNDLLTNSQLSEEQLNLIRDIRRRGKNKIAAQNCRKRKMDVLLGLNDNVSSLMRRRSRLLREKQETLRNLQEMKRQLRKLYQDVFSRLRDEEGRPLNPVEYLLHFEANGGVTVAAHEEGTVLPLTKPSKKKRDKKK